jgi:hypothetical protein
LPWREAAIVAVTITICGFIVRDFISAEWHADAAEREIADLAGRIPIDATREYVVTAFTAGKYRHVSLRTPGAWDRWYFHTPSRFGASDWVLIVTFDGDRVTAVRVGTSDDVGRRPEGAPPHRGTD